MKFDWGMGIAMFYGLFMVVMISVVIRTTYYDHALVSEQYYADDLAYQSHYEKLSNTLGLEKDLQIEFNEDKSGIRLDFPAYLKPIQGEIVFFRPSDKAADFTVVLAPDADNRQLIPVPGLDPGLWKVKVEWATPEKAFFTEKVLIF